ncbi:MAG: histone deacetylase, partial [Candidatus Glassbacteria bacterium]
MEAKTAGKYRVGLLCDPVFELHDTGSGHPENAARLVRIAEALAAGGLDRRCRRIEPVEADRDSLLAVHTGDYLDRLESVCRTGAEYIDTPDSCICPASWRVACLAAGGVMRSAALVAEGELDRAFCAVRPPGHHAERHLSLGFCLLNNVALAAVSLKKSYGFQRIAILDWDVHHGNGTQHIFEADPSVLYVSLHQDPHTLFPGTGLAGEAGTGAGRGTVLNLPLAPGTGDEEYLAVFRGKALPAIESFGPQIILISAGFDPHADDPLASLNLTVEAFSRMIEAVCELSGRVCEGRIVSVLEGGYDLNVLAEAVTRHVRALLGDLLT